MSNLVKTICKKAEWPTEQLGPNKNLVENEYPQELTFETFIANPSSSTQNISALFPQDFLSSFCFVSALFSIIIYSFSCNRAKLGHSKYLVVSEQPVLPRKEETVEMISCTKVMSMNYGMSQNSVA